MYECTLMYRTDAAAAAAAAALAAVLIAARARTTRVGGFIERRYDSAMYYYREGTSIFYCTSQ